VVVSSVTPAGFAAASYYRGLDVIQVPTTLLAMVDSAIGGKTGVNLPEGKNLVGAFHQPCAVFANPRVLASLPDRDYRCGLGEIAKYALMGDDFVSARSTRSLRVIRRRSPR
jgi:3-dehydroquinate synthetase